MNARVLATAGLLLTAAGVAAAAALAQPPRITPRAPPRRHASVTEGMECSACHTTDGWRVEAVAGEEGGFDHARTGFPLGGAHALAACSGCHAPERGTPPRRECASCHADAHDGRLGGSCDGCHSAASWRRTRPIELHRRTLLPLTGMHVLADCTGCHRRTGEQQWSDAPSDCYSCHTDDYLAPGIHPVHDGSRGDPPFPHDCGGCHRTTGWSPAFVDPAVLGSRSPLRQAPAVHEARFPIASGRHRGADCASCHIAPEAPAAVRCTGCHAHGPARLRSDHGRGIVTGDGPSCLGCHPGGSAR